MLSFHQICTLKTAVSLECLGDGESFRRCDSLRLDMQWYLIKLIKYAMMLDLNDYDMQWYLMKYNRVTEKSAFLELCCSVQLSLYIFYV